jgi:magnesium-transporting ATPase (P-type)
MRRALATANKNKTVISAAILQVAQMAFVGALLLISAASTFAQNAELQQELAAVKQSAAQNKQRLRQSQWTETIQIH